MKEISKEVLEKRIETLEKKVAELEGLVQEQPSIEKMVEEIIIKLSKSASRII